MSEEILEFFKMKIDAAAFNNDFEHTHFLCDLYLELSKYLEAT